MNNDLVIPVGLLLLTLIMVGYFERIIGILFQIECHLAQRNKGR